MVKLFRILGCCLKEGDIGMGVKHYKK